MTSRRPRGLNRRRDSVSKKKAHGMVTAPLSKTGIAAAGLRDRGHTEILQRLSRGKDVYMAFWGRKFNVLLLLTDHRPLMSVAKLAHTKANPCGRRKRRKTCGKLPNPEAAIGLVGLNPHAGEKTGCLVRKKKPSFRLFFKEMPENVIGPLVPDTAFLPENWKKYSVYVCPYHDQGLIPFKLVHGFKEGVHLTLGLPFVRTSVDHGTAKELFGLRQGEAWFNARSDRARHETRLPGVQDEMMDPVIFREYDIRGVYNTDFDADFAYELGRAFITYLVRTKKADRIAARLDRP